MRVSVVDEPNTHQKQQQILKLLNRFVKPLEAKA